MASLRKSRNLRKRLGKTLRKKSKMSKKTLKKMKPRKSRKLRKLGKFRKRVKKGGTVRRTDEFGKWLEGRVGGAVAARIPLMSPKEWKEHEMNLAQQDAFDLEDYSGVDAGGVDMRAQKADLEFQAALNRAKEAGIDVEDLVGQNVNEQDVTRDKSKNQYEVDGWVFKKRKQATIAKLIEDKLKQKSPPPSLPSQDNFHVPGVVREEERQLRHENEDIMNDAYSVLIENADNWSNNIKNISTTITDGFTAEKKRNPHHEDYLSTIQKLFVDPLREMSRSAKKPTREEWMSLLSKDKWGNETVISFLKPIIILLQQSTRIMAFKQLFPSRVEEESPPSRSSQDTPQNKPETKDGSTFSKYFARRKTPTDDSLIKDNMPASDAIH